MAFIEHERLVPFVGVAWDSLRDSLCGDQIHERHRLEVLLKQFDKEKSRSQ